MAPKICRGIMNPQTPSIHTVGVVPILSPCLGYANSGSVKFSRPNWSMRRRANALRDVKLVPQPTTEYQHSFSHTLCAIVIDMPNRL